MSTDPSIRRFTGTTVAVIAVCSLVFGCAVGFMMEARNHTNNIKLKIEQGKQVYLAPDAGDVITLKGSDGSPADMIFTGTSPCVSSTDKSKCVINRNRGLYYYTCTHAGNTDACFDPGSDPNSTTEPFGLKQEWDGFLLKWRKPKTYNSPAAVYRSPANQQAPATAPTVKLTPNASTGHAIAAKTPSNVVIYCDETSGDAKISTPYPPITGGQTIVQWNGNQDLQYTFTLPNGYGSNTAICTDNNTQFSRDGRYSCDINPTDSPYNAPYAVHVTGCKGTADINTTLPVTP